MRVENNRTERGESIDAPPGYLKSEKKLLQQAEENAKSRGGERKRPANEKDIRGT